VLAVTGKEDGELWPLAASGKVLPGAGGSHRPECQRCPAWLLAGCVRTQGSTECVVFPCPQQQSPRDLPFLPAPTET